MNITFEQLEQGLTEFAADLNELNESLGNLRQAGASPDYLKIIKAALKQKAVLSVSPNSKVIAIEGHDFDELVADIRAASKKSGEFGLFYVGTASGTHVVVNNESSYSDKLVGMNTDVKTLTLGKNPVTGEDQLEIYDGSGWRSSFRAQKIKDLKNRLQVAVEGYKGFIVIKDPDLAKLRAERQAVVNRATKENTFPAVDKMQWSDLVRLDKVASNFSYENVAQIGDVVFTYVRGGLKNSVQDLSNGGYDIFRLEDAQSNSYVIKLDLKGLRLEKK